MRRKVGCLHVVATPIGNLGDITYRAVDTLRSADLILAEDTRHSGRLCQHYAIESPLWSYHQHNEEQRLPQVLEKLRVGQRLALIADAGTPLISDPGFRIVRACRESGIPVWSLPGPNAAVAALSISGLAANRFCFEGFLPAKSVQRMKQLETLRHESRTLVFYESRHRVVDTLEDLVEVFGAGRYVVLVKELTKIHERIYSGEPAEIIAQIRADPAAVKGEFVLLVSGQDHRNGELLGDAERRLLEVLLKRMPLKEAVKTVADHSGKKKNAIYQLALQLRDE